MSVARALDREAEEFFDAPTGRGRTQSHTLSTDAIEARDDQIVVLYSGGMTLEEVAAVVGCTRENVRLRLVRRGLHVRHRGADVDILRILTIVRHPDTMSLAGAARALGMSEPSGVWLAIARMGMQRAVSRLLRWRRHYAVVRRFRALGEQLGRTPTISDMRAIGLHQSDIQRRFGGMQRMAERAGLTPRVTGRPAKYEHSEDICRAALATLGSHQ